MFKYLFILFGLLISIGTFAQKKPIQNERGKILAKKCIDCHGTNQALLADPLQGIRKIRTEDYINSLMKNPNRFTIDKKNEKKVGF